MKADRVSCINAVLKYIIKIGKTKQLKKMRFTSTAEGYI